MKVKLFTIRLSEEHLHIDQSFFNGFTEGVNVKKVVANIVQFPYPYWSVIVFYGSNEIISTKKAVPTGRQENREENKLTVEDLTEEEKEMYKELREWRRKKSIELELPQYLICHNADLGSVTK